MLRAAEEAARYALIHFLSSSVPHGHHIGHFLLHNHMENHGWSSNDSGVDSDDLPELEDVVQ